MNKDTTQKALDEAQKAFDNPKHAKLPKWKKALLALLAAGCVALSAWLTSCGTSISYDPDSGQVLILIPQKVEKGK